MKATSRLTLVALFGAFVVTKPEMAGAQGSPWCPGINIPNSCGEKGVDPETHTLVGDPIDIASGGSFVKRNDATIRGSVATLTLYRMFTSRPEAWDYNSSFYDGSLSGVPAPYGSSNADLSSLKWWHSFFTFVQGGSSTTTAVRAPSGRLVELGNCSTPPCWVSTTLYNNAIRDRLRLDTSATFNSYTYMTEDGTQYTYNQGFQSLTSGRWYTFLDHITSPSGVKTASIIYHYPPQDATFHDMTSAGCVQGASGSSPGVPYIQTVTNEDGDKLRFTYKTAKDQNGATECVLDTVFISNGAGAYQKQAVYTYAQYGGFVGSDLWSASVAQSSDGSAQATETYTYSAPNTQPATFSAAFASAAGAESNVNDVYGGGNFANYGGSCGTEAPSATQISGANIPVSWGSPSSCGATHSIDDPCALSGDYRTLGPTSSALGDGSNTASQYTNEYAAVPGFMFGLHVGRVNSVKTACLNMSCGAGTVVYGWMGLNGACGSQAHCQVTGGQCTQQSDCPGDTCLPANLGYEAWTTAKYSGASATTATFTPQVPPTISRSYPIPAERAGVIRGAAYTPVTLPTMPVSPDTTKGFHQDSEFWTYEYRGDDSQWRSTALRHSEDGTYQNLVGAHYQYENGAAAAGGGGGSTGPNTRLKHVWIEGRTSDVANKWTTQDYHTFYKTIASCGAGGGGGDSLARTVEVHGPCLGNNAGGGTGGPDTAADCGGTAYPITKLTYHASSSSGDYSAGKIATIARYPSGCSSTPVVTTYTQYDAWGNPTQITDGAGATFVLTYVDHRVASIQATSEPSPNTTSFTYENGNLIAIQHPQGNYDVFCYRDAAPGTSCSGVWHPRIHWKAKSANSDGTGATEVAQFAYWPDGQLETVTTGNMSGGVFVARTVHQYAPDAQGRPTFESWGDGSPPNTAPVYGTRGFDIADGLDGVGFPYNNPHSFCSSGTASGTDTACSLMTNEPRGYQDSLKEFPTANGTAIVTRYCNDQNGHLALVTRNASSTWGVATSDATCTITGANAAADELNSIRYQWDDFGRLVSITSPETYDHNTGGRGVLRMEYDPMGNVLTRQSQQQRTSNIKRQFTYDQLGRILTVTQVWSGTPTLLYAFTYDRPDPVGPPPDPCASFSGLTHTGGRLVKESDPGGDATYYGYDSYGHLTGEYRTRNGGACSTINSDATPNTTYAYSHNGDITQVVYPHGRTVLYGYYPAGTGQDDRVSSVSATKWSGGAWTSPIAIVNSVNWEPYGGLRSYVDVFPDFPGHPATVAYDHGAAGSGSNANCTLALDADDHTGRLRALTVSTGAPSTWGNLYKKFYQWSKDQILEIDTCYSAGQSVPQREHFGDIPAGYDQLLRVQNIQAPNWGTVGGARTGGWVYAAPFGSLNNRSQWSVDQFGNNYTAQYAAQATAVPSWLATYSAGEALNYENSYVGGTLPQSLSTDEDGRVLTRYWPYDSGGTYSVGMTYDAQNGYGGVDGVLKSVNVNGSTYQYWYDAETRRRRKVYPIGSGSYYDEFFYTRRHQLLEDRGFASSSDASMRIDEYVWLGGRPVAYYRSGFNSLGVRQNDGTGTCSRFTDTNTSVLCGLYYPVTDHVGKPVINFDASQRVTGVGEYDPFGRPNRIQWWVYTGHPYANNLNQTLATITEPNLNGMTNSVRLHFPTFDVEHVQTCSTQPPFLCIWSGDVLQLQSGVSPFTVLEGKTGYHRGDVWTGWYTSTTSPNFRIQFVSDSQNCNPSGCNSGTGWPYTGVVLREYEYQRYSTGASPVFPPLRAMGQYFDQETDLYENWNRFYNPLTGRYLTREPLLSNPLGMRRMARAGHSVAAYAYAGNNPVEFVDPTGLEHHLADDFEDSTLPNMNADLGAYLNYRDGISTPDQYERGQEIAVVGAVADGLVLVAVAWEFLLPFIAPTEQQAERFNWSDTVNRQCRVYQTQQMADMIYDHGNFTPDPQGVPGRLLYTAQGSLNQVGGYSAQIGQAEPSYGTYEMLVNEDTMTIEHFLFRSNNH